MIVHCVFCNIRSDVPNEDRVQVFEHLAALCQPMTGFIDFEHGPNRDFEMKSQAYSDGFVIRFESPAALEHYAKHPTHIKLGQRLSDLCVGGGDGIIVFDLEVAGGA
jgi:hypothetical protein